MKILIVDNDSVMLSLMKRMLAGESYRVKTATNGNDALRAYRHFKPDLIITDIQMPRTSGLELIRHVRQTRPHTHTMLITAFGSSELKEEAQSLGAAFLSKPFSLFEFVATVQSILAEEPLDWPEEPVAIEEELEALVC